MQEKSLKKNAFYSFIKAFMNMAFPIISFPYASRILMPEGIGKVNFANSIIEYFVLFATLGIFGYATREASRVRNDKKALNKICREILIIHSISTLCSYFLLFIAFVFVPKFNDYRMLIIVTSSKILFTTLGMDWLYNAFEEYKYISLRSVFFQLLSLVILFAFVHTPDDYVLYAGMGVFASVGSNICNVFYSRKFVNFFDKTQIELKKHLKPIFIFFGNSCASKLHNALDTVMIGFMMNDSAVGYYSAANKIKGLVVGLITSVLGIFMPRSSYYINQNKIDEYKKMIKKTANAALFFGIPASVGIALVCKPLIILFSGAEYLEAIPSMLILSPVVAILAFSNFLLNVILIPNRKEKVSLQSQIIGCTVNIILNSIFIPIWGIFGASFATLIVEVLIMSYLTIFSFEYLKGIGIFKILFQTIFSCFVMFLAITVIMHFVQNIYIQLFGSVLSGIILYGLCSILLKNEIALEIVQNIKKRIFRK